MAEVIGTDLSPKQSSRVPSNWFVPVKFVLTAIRLIDAICSRFEVDDAMLEWTFQEVRIRPQVRFYTTDNFIKTFSISYILVISAQGFQVGNTLLPI